MRLLIAVSSCVSDLNKGHHLAIRNTYAQHLPANVDLRFFIGTAASGPLEQEEPNWQKDYSNLCRVKSHMIRPAHAFVPATAFDDEILLDVPDSYAYVSHKTRAKLKWAVERDYDVVFRTDTDTFTDVDALLQAGFDDDDYVGEASDLSGGAPGYAFGGTGVWLSRRACAHLQDAPLTCLADDVWISDILKQHGIYVKHSNRFCYDLGEAREVKPITVHLGGRTGSYNNKAMYEAYRILLDRVPPKNEWSREARER